MLCAPWGACRVLTSWVATMRDAKKTYKERKTLTSGGGSAEHFADKKRRDAAAAKKKAALPKRCEKLTPAGD